jgi:TRAP-type C4-dicarboxylate transport system substrate-binding protein
VRTKISVLLLATIMVLSSVISGCSGKDKEAIELSYSNFFPSTHLNSILAQEWIKEIEKRSEGAVKVTYYAGGSLTSAAKIYDGVTQGISDIGMSCFSYTPGRFPACELVDLPHGYPNGYVATMVANDFYKQFKPAELKDVQPLYFHAHGPGVIVTTKKPVSTLEDLKGLVIRSTGVGATIIQALGAQGYGASQGEAYELLSKGVVDGSFTTVESLKGWKQAETVKYVTNCNDLGYTTMMFVVMNKAKWDSLPGKIQKIINDVSSEWIEKHGMVWDYYDQTGADYFLSLGQGRQMINLSAAEEARWSAVAVEPLIQKYISDKSAQGLTAKQYQDYLLERVSYWSARSKSLAESVGWVKKELEPLMVTTAAK